MRIVFEALKGYDKNFDNLLEDLFREYEKNVSYKKGFAAYVHKRAPSVLLKYLKEVDKTIAAFEKEKKKTEKRSKNRKKVCSPF